MALLNKDRWEVKTNRHPGKLAKIFRLGGGVYGCPLGQQVLHIGFLEIDVIGAGQLLRQVVTRRSAER